MPSMPIFRFQEKAFPIFVPEGQRRLASGETHWHLHKSACPLLRRSIMFIEPRCLTVFSSRGAASAMERCRSSGAQNLMAAKIYQHCAPPERENMCRCHGFLHRLISCGASGAENIFLNVIEPQTKSENEPHLQLEH